ncbi:hypothetical protein L195_g048655, partial [Trifolium pratense]
SYPEFEFKFLTTNYVFPRLELDRVVETNEVDEGHTNNSLKRHCDSHSEDSPLFRTKKRVKKFVEGDTSMSEIAKTFQKMVDVFEMSCAELLKQTKKNADVENLWAQLEDIGVKYPYLPQVYIYLAQHPDALKAFNGLPVDVRLKVLPSIVPRYLLNCITRSNREE